MLPIASQAAETRSAEAASRPQQHDPVTAAFSEHDPQSKIKLDHSLWSDLLGKTVIFAGHATRPMGRGRKRKWVGSRMRFGNDLPSRYENNRIVLSGFGKEHFAALRQYREALESAPDQLPLARLNRSEQLAYWLNLYNAHALEHVAAHYPAETTRALRSAPGDKPDGVWHERTLEVAGVPLSLVDIERKILFPIWNDPLVLYGLWQGAIGGPRLPLRPYTGADVWPMLRENASEFVNSNRSMDADGKVLEVSLLYTWGAPLFDGEEGLRRHIHSLALPPFSNGLETVQQIEPGRYDWHLADLSGGTHHQGMWNNTAAFAAAVSGTRSNTANAWANFAIRTDNTRERMPAQTIELLRNMAAYNDRSRRTRVSLTDCSSGSDCGATTTGDDKASNPQPDRGR